MILLLLIIIDIISFHVYYGQVEPGLIRVDADEVTYPLHIILRFELEQALFADADSVSIQ